MFARASLGPDREGIGLVCILGSSDAAESGFPCIECTLCSLDIDEHKQNIGERNLKKICKY